MIPITTANASTAIWARAALKRSTHNKNPDRLSLIKSNKLSCVSSGCHEFIHDVASLKDDTSGRRSHSDGPVRTERRIRWASLLVGAGLLVQLVSLLVVHPLAFVAFLMVGCPLMAAGIVLYLFSLVP